MLVVFHGVVFYGSIDPKDLEPIYGSSSSSSILNLYMVVVVYIVIEYCKPYLLYVIVFTKSDFYFEKNFLKTLYKRSDR